MRRSGRGVGDADYKTGADFYRGLVRLANPMSSEIMLPLMTRFARGGADGVGVLFLMPAGALAGGSTI